MKRQKSCSDELIFSLRPSVYPLEAIYATCYVFLDSFYIVLDKIKGKIIISLRFKSKPNTNRDRDIAQKRFMDELISNTLRNMIARRNQKVKEHIVKTALFFSQPQSQIDKFLFRQDAQATHEK